ncbi:hypothetical protein BS78_01G129300 [Paspalum vaginatum]|nr:hypothetical protein BS78_01G129300 [Paspalum vaginatum]KAJ1294223.1 hypothetical protein BS78_01G129300 [Paspalum vaginatum]
MEDTRLFMKGAAAALNTLLLEHPPLASDAIHYGGGEFIEATFPSLQALREASYASEMVQELITGNVPTASWNLGAASAQPAGNGMSMMEAPAATRGLPGPDLVVYEPPSTRRAGSKSTGSMAASYAQDHIIAERKRREKINQRFVELSAVIPGLKKMDKATILSDAARYVKELQEKVKDMEAGGSSSRNIETLVLVKRPCLHAAAVPEEGDDGSPLPASSPGSTPTDRKQLPEIEVQVSEKSVAVRVHCENRKGVVVNVLSGFEELHLSTIHANVMPFTACTLIIAITAKVEEGFTVTAEEVVGRLSSAVLDHQHAGSCMQQH